MLADGDLTPSCKSSLGYLARGLIRIDESTPTARVVQKPQRARTINLGAARQL